MFVAVVVMVALLCVIGSVQPGNAQESACNESINLIPHPYSCQRYTNCSKVDKSDSWYLKDKEEECSYPDLFDVVEYTCKNFKEAICGFGRVAAKDPCDYVKNKCGGPHCEPCGSRFPSCVGLSNGIHPHSYKLWSPYYIKCDLERTIEVKQCPKHVATASISIFSPVKNSCVSRWEIPQENGGLKPSCDGKEARMYRVADKPQVYYSCPGAEVSYCQNGYHFNEAKQVCGSNVRFSQT